MLDPRIGCSEAITKERVIWFGSGLEGNCLQIPTIINFFLFSGIFFSLNFVSRGKCVSGGMTSQ
jgi:hypothetical protein